MTKRKAALAGLTIAPVQPAPADDRRRTGTRGGKVSLGRLYPNPDQPRKSFEEAAILLLAADIGENGQIQPIVVRSPDEDGRHMIVAGERRWRAMAKLDAYASGSRLVDVVVDFDIEDDDQAFERAFAENIQRDDLTRAEVAAALLRLKDRHELSNAALAHRVHKSKAWVDQHLRFAQLPEETRDLMDRQRVDLKVAGVIAGLDPATQQAVIRGLEEVSGQREQMGRARTTRQLVDEGLAPAEAAERAAVIHFPKNTEYASGGLPRTQERGADPAGRRGRPPAASMPFVLEAMAEGPPRVRVNPKALATCRLLALPSAPGVRRWLEAVAADLADFRDVCASHEHGGGDWELVGEIVGPTLAEKY